jgi:hypothetical protein
VRIAEPLAELDANHSEELLFPTWGSFAPIQVGLTECLLSDIAENAVSFSYRLELI